MKRIAWKPLLTGVLLGCLIGAGAATWCQRGHFRRHRGPDTERMVRKFSRELNLDAKQQESVRAIFEGRRKQMEEMRKEASLKFDEARASIHAEIEKLLTPEQKEKFEVLKKKREEKRKKWERRP